MASPASIDDLKKILSSRLKGAGFSWAVAGGWAIDLFLNRQTRTHKDVEIAVWRDQQALVRAHFALWEVAFMRAGASVSWSMDVALELPVHEIHARHPADDVQIEILLNERSDGHWIFRRANAITRDAKRFMIKSSSGLSSVAPEVVLLYKATNPTKSDILDFETCLPHLEADRVLWLRKAIASAYPNRPWLFDLAGAD
ncbi:MAG: hypothetical protein QOC56_402 [Alphaproteobacteria bacterium]|jgi:hypothetical protein|nr:hypothetical protein [Alphaproteobacteria bacterium]